MAELNLSLFRGTGKGTQGDVYGEDFSLEDWVLFNGKLMKADNPQIQGHSLPVLKPNELLHHLVVNSWGKVVKK